MNHLEIRSATLLDLTQISAVELSAATAFSQLPLAFLQQLPNDIPPRRSSFYHSMVGLGTSWVLCFDEKVIGFICTERLSEENCLHIHEFAIAQAFQRKGFGENLLKHVIIWAEQQQIARLTLTTFKEVPWNAPFYKKVGFSIVSEENLDKRLQALLQGEVQVGLPYETRCAMELLVG